MNSREWFDAGADNNVLPPVHWEELGAELRGAAVVKRYSGVVGDAPSLLMLERVRLAGGPRAALAQLRMKNARLGGVGEVIHLNELETPIGTLVRTAFRVIAQTPRTIVAASAQPAGGLGLVMQFVLPALGQDREELECLSRLAIGKALEVLQTDRDIGTR